MCLPTSNEKNENVSDVRDKQQYTRSTAQRYRLCARVILAHTIALIVLAESLSGMEVMVADEYPLVDGQLNESAWKTADSVNVFIQKEPDEGDPSSEPTTAYVLQDDWALYFAFRCETAERQPDCRHGVHDSQEGDYVSVYIDTYLDGRNAYRFAVSCAGTRSDAIISEHGFEENLSWDGVFYSNTQVFEWGYTVEMAIPWEALRFDPAADTWGFVLERNIPVRAEISHSTPMRKDDVVRVSRFEKLTGIKPVSTRQEFDFYPHVFYRTEDSYGEELSSFNLALDFNYRPVPWLQIQSTFNPDFSQVEADRFAMNLSRYSLYFPEKRPFFVEGNEFFRPSGGAVAGLEQIFYSRNIGMKVADGTEVGLDAGARVTMRKQKIEFGGLLAATSSHAYESWMGEAVEPRAFYSVERFNYELFDHTTVALSHAGKNSKDIDNHVFSIDGTTITSNVQLSYQVSQSRYDGIADWQYSGYFHYVPDNFVIKAWATKIEDEFNVSEIGFIPWTGLRSYSVTAGPSINPGSGLLSYANLLAAICFEKELEEEEYSRVYTWSAWITFRNDWGIGIDYSHGRSYELGIDYDPQNYAVSIQSDVSRRAWFMLFYSSGRSYNYQRGYLGRNDYMSLYSTWRPSSRFVFWINSLSWVERRPDGGIEEITYTLRPGLTWNIAKGMDLRVYEETPIDRSDGMLSHRLGVSYSYNFLPKSWLYIAFNDYQYRINGKFEPRQRVLAIKYRHLLSL